MDLDWIIDRLILLQGEGMIIKCRTEDGRVFEPFSLEYDGNVLLICED